MKTSTSPHAPVPATPSTPSRALQLRTRMKAGLLIGLLLPAIQKIR
jgi:hypothetical protein